MTAEPTRRPSPAAAWTALVPGLATTCLLAVVLGLAAVWYRDHLWQAWNDAGWWVLVLACLALAALPGLLVGLFVDRQRRLAAALARRDEEIGTAKADLDRTNRALLALSAVNRELVRAADRDEFLGRICQAMVEQSGYGLVWVGMADPGPDKRVRVVARAGEEAVWLDTLGVRHDASIKGRGPAGTAIREGRMVLVPRFQDEPFFRDWPDRPASLDQYVSAAVFPLRVEGRVAGALSIYERRQREFGQEEIELLARMAEDISHGLHFLRLAATRERAALLLRQALRTSSAMVSITSDMVAGDMPLPDMAAMVLRRAMALTGSPLGAVGVTEERTGRIDWLATVGPRGPFRPDAAEACEFYPDDTGRFPGPFAATLNTGVPIRHNEPASLAAYSLCFPDQGQVRRFLSVPLRRTAHGPGGLILLADAPVPYVERDSRTAQRLAVLFDMGAARLRVETELVAARRRAEAANEAKTQFLANVSHELRTPINGILGMTQLAILEGVVEPEAEYWQTVRDATDRLVAIVDNLLELASVESGSLSPMLREFSLRRMLESLRSAFSVRAGLAGLTLGLDVDATLPDRFLGDPFRLRQILANLLDNAIRFTPTGGVSLRVTPFDPEAAGGQRRVCVAGDFAGLSLVFAVSDTGIGIPKDKQASIFESFTLAEEHLTKRYGGTGIGLAIARRLAELLGGSIWVESRPGFGSTFYLTVPLWPAAAEADAGQTPVLPADLPPLRFLVVEDEAVNRLALSRSLRKLGHEVFEAGNGEEALRTLAQEAVDVCIMDVQMPVMDGLTAVAHIRHGEVPGVNRRLPVVALTAYALEGDRKRFLEAGMDEFVTKPCDMDQLLRAVAKVVGGKAAATPAAAGPDSAN